MPLGNGLSVTVSSGKDAPALEQINNNPAAANVTMGDDSFVTVPLPFGFSYWGQEFTTSRMYSNGVVNFTNNGIPGNYCCDGQNLATLTNTAYNYSIMPLWTDLIAQSGSHYVLSTTSAVTYGWYSVNEFGTGNRSSFEVKIDSTGLVDIRFSDATVTSHSVTSGLTGDLALGQYYQYSHAGSISLSALGWSLPTTTVMVPDPCAQALTTPGCPGFAGADSMSDTPAAPEAVAVGSVNTMSSSMTTVPGEQSTPRSAPGPGQILGIIRSEQNRVSAAEAQAQELTNAAVSRAADTAASTVQSSIQPNSTMPDSSAGREVPVRESANNTRAAQDGHGPATDAAAALVNPGLALPGMKDLGANSNNADTSNNATASVNRSAANNEAAGGVDIAQLARTPAGFSQYQIAMPDGTGYQPKEIYRNQTVIDNQRVLRGMTGATDRVHQQMIEQQYR